MYKNYFWLIHVGAFVSEKFHVLSRTNAWHPATMQLNGATHIYCSRNISRHNRLDLLRTCAVVDLQE